MASSDACNQLPAASSDCQPQGTWETIAGLRTYITGQTTSPTRALIFIYDIFGPAPQTLLGADLLAASPALAPDTLVLAPDFFRGEPVDPAWMPPAGDPAKQARVDDWRRRRAGIEENVAVLLAVKARAVEERPEWKGVGSWGVFGLCWGAKVGVKVLGEGNEGEGRAFRVGGTAHPSKLDAADAEALTVPYIMLASPGEPADLVAAYAEVLARPGRRTAGVVETYPGMFHGWMGGRARLEDPANRAEYARGYAQVAEFFGEHL